MLVSRHDREAAFTLVELLVVIGIVALLIALSAPAMGNALQEGRMVREVSAGKNLLNAFQLYASDHNGQLLPAMDDAAGGPTGPVWFQPYQRNITYAEAPHRYPFRLAPYLGYQLESAILLPENKKQIIQAFGAISGANTMSDYGVSLLPAFGMNYNFVGGTSDASGHVGNAGECVTRQSQADHSVIVFASAGSILNAITFSGYFKVDPPTGSPTSPAWSAAPWNKQSNPASYGAIDARYDGRAVCAFLDGSVKMETLDQLRDMRLWSRQAAINQNPNYVEKLQ